MSHILLQRQFLTLTAILLLAGCTTLGITTEPIPVDAALSPAAQKAQNVINEANLTLTSAANVIAQKKAAGVITRSQAQSDLNKVKKFAADLDRAQALLDSGFTLDAETLAAVLNKGLLALHKELSARKAKP